MSPAPVPTSSSVALGPRSGSTSATSASTARAPPKSVFASATSARERVTSAGSTSGPSRISTPRRRAGVRRAATLPLELRVAAAVVEQRRQRPRARRLGLAHEDRVVPALVLPHPPALDGREHVVEQGDAGLPALEADPFEPVGVAPGEAARERLLAGGEDVDGEVWGRAEHRVDARLVVDADEDERGREAERAEGADGHPVIEAALVARRDHGDAGGEAAEDGAECVWVERHEVRRARGGVCGTLRGRRRRHAAGGHGSADSGSASRSAGVWRAARGGTRSLSR